ncbi:DNA-directed RNA polymerase I subunit RPA12-like [Asterias amurensis]|uniref:DNA-directed RNA polymerase I subunit RPA12-like n=1 Tax=Asterias amurensis TaxID=7602 RepID=UPI003AB18B54
MQKLHHMVWSIIHTCVSTLNKNVEGCQEVVGQKDLGPLIDRPCAKCRPDGLHFHTRQTRSADERQTVFYFCPSCKHQKFEYS